ncbi:MAG TPA: zinc ribbon domain-containing protein [Gemmatimonadales bacterium]|jgi:transcription initiation factor TFIIIB Brf1 subunit/transcription initiation factor TFIIB
MTQPSPDLPLGQLTAEWICTRCGSTNRRLVAAGVTRAEDVCLRCHTVHVIEADARPVRWRARAKEK